MARNPNLIGLEKGRQTRSRKIMETTGKVLTATERNQMNTKKIHDNPLWESMLDSCIIFHCVECESLFNDSTGDVDERICNNCLYSEDI